jgi:SRSO17 transposase
VKHLNNEVAVGAIVGDGAWLRELRRELFELLAGVFAQARSRLAAFAYVGALLAGPGDRRSCWQLAEQAGHASPRRMQALLAGHRWDWKDALAALQRFLVAGLGDPEAILAVDETAELKRGSATVGVARQYAGITGQVENCQAVVVAAYVTPRGHAPFDFRLYLPKSWFRSRARRAQARVPARTRFATKPALAAQMVTAAVAAGVPFAWVTGDEVYGRSGRLRRACEKARKGHVPEVPVNFQVRLPSGRKAAVSAVAAMVPAAAWETRSCGPGCKGRRDYQWAWAATASPRHWLLTRRSLGGPSDLAFYCCHVPQGRLVSLTVLVAVTGKRWPVEECHQQGKGQTGLDQHQVRLWHSFCRHTVLSMCAQALLAVAAARPAPAPPPGDASCSAGAAQRAAWRDTGKLPASPGDRPPAGCGMVKVSVPQARRLARFAAAPMTRTAREAGYAWSRWRRRHQARARWHHCHARLKALAGPLIPC